MTDRASLKRIIEEGRNVDNFEYSNSYQIHSVKTFYYFLKRIVKYENSPLSSDRLRRYIKDELRKSGVKTGSGFNPEGWFGALWTYSLDGIWQNFRPEYTEILQRIGNEPYEYFIRPEKFNMIKEILQEIETNIVNTAPSQSTEGVINALSDRKPVEELRKDSIAEDVAYPDEIKEDALYPEGGVKSVLVNRYERNQSARRACLEYYGTSCFVCGFNFERVYGSHGRGYIHVHHLVSLSSVKENYEVNPIKDLRPVCPNCHAMLHLKEPPISIERLQQIIIDTK